MRTTTFLKTSAASTMIALLVAAGAAFADHDNKGGDRGGGDRSFSSGDKSGGSSRSFLGGSDRSSRTFSRSADNDRNNDSHSTFRSSKGSDDSGRTGKSGDRLFQFKSDQSGSPFKQGSREYQTRRPNDDQVRDFLKLKGNDNAGRTRDRSPQERELVDREFNQWHNIWSGDKNDKGDKGNNNHDHRDWSGNWKNSDRFTIADHIRHDWRDRHDRDSPFFGNWWNGSHRGN